MTTPPWTFKRLFLVGVFAAGTFAASFVVGNAITLALGPGMSGIATIVITTILAVVCARLVETRGVLTLLVGLFTLLAWPTNMFGPPGPQKIVIGLFTGLVYDCVWLLTGRRRYSLPLAAAVSTALSILLIFALMVLMAYPRKEYLQSLLKYLVPLYAFLGFLGALIGNWIYDRSLSRISIVLQLKA